MHTLSMVTLSNGQEANETFYHGDTPTCEGTTSPQQGREANAYSKEIPTE